MNISLLGAYLRGPWAVWREVRFEKGWKRASIIYVIVHVVVVATAFLYAFLFAPDKLQEALQLVREQYSFTPPVALVLMTLQLVALGFVEMVIRGFSLYVTATALGGGDRLDKAFQLAVYSALPAVVFEPVPLLSTLVYIYVFLLLAIGFYELFHLSKEKSVIGVFMGLAAWYILGLVFWAVVSVVGFFLYALFQLLTT